MQHLFSCSTLFYHWGLPVPGLVCGIGFLWDGFGFMAAFSTSTEHIYCNAPKSIGVSPFPARLPFFLWSCTCCLVRPSVFQRVGQGSPYMLQEHLWCIHVRQSSEHQDLSRVGRGAESPRFYRPLPTLLNRCLCGSLTQLSFEPALFIDFSLKSIFYHLGNKCHYFTLHYFITTSNHMMCR